MTEKNKREAEGSNLDIVMGVTLGAGGGEP